MSDLLPDCSESDFQDWVIARLDEAGAWWYHTHDSRRCPPGYPDLHVCDTRRERAFFVELKTAKGKLSADQERVIAVLRRCKQVVHVWRPADAPQILAELGLAPDRRAVVTAVGADPQPASITHARGAEAVRRERGREIRGAGVGPDGATQDDETTAALTARVRELCDAGIGPDAAVLTARRELGLEVVR